MEISTLISTKAKVLVKGPKTQHVFNRKKHFFEIDPDLQEIVQDFTLDMFTTKGIEVLGSPVDTDIYINGFVHFQQFKFCMNTHTQYIIANISIPSPDHFLSLKYQHIDRTSTNTILQKGTVKHRCLLHPHFRPDSSSEFVFVG